MPDNARLADEQVVTVIRDLFPRCGICGQDISGSNPAELVPVPGRNRLAHTRCMS